MNDAALISSKFGQDMVPGIMSESYIAPVVSKWSPLLEGVEDPWRRRVIGALLENEARYLNDFITEEVRTTQIGTFLKYIFPIIRRSWAQVISLDLVSVQAMTQPVGGVAFYRPRYGSSKGAVSRDDEAIVNFDRDYTSERVNGQSLGTGDGANLVFVGTAKTPVRPGTLSVKLGATVAGTANAAGTIVDAGAGLIAAGSQVNATTGAVTVVFASAPASGVSVLVDYEFDMEGNPDIPQFRFDIQITEIRAKPRKMKLLWSAEAEEDLRALWGQDMTANLVGDASQEMALEVDREVIKDLEDAAVAGSNFKNFDAKAPSGVSLEQHLRGIVVPISQLSYQIHKRTHRGPATWIVTSPEVASLLESTPFFTMTSDMTMSGGIMKVGTLQGKWTVYVDPYFTRNRMLLGRQGNSQVDTGYILAPYIPLQVTGTFMDPGDFTLRKGLRTRYAKLLVRSEFYGYISVSNL